MEHGEEERCERHDREERLAEPGVDVHEPVVDECERGPEVERAVDDGASERASARQLQSQHGHEHEEQTGS